MWVRWWANWCAISLVECQNNSTTFCPLLVSAISHPWLIFYLPLKPHVPQQVSWGLSSQTTHFNNEQQWDPFRGEESKGQPLFFRLKKPSLALATYFIHVNVNGRLEWGRLGDRPGGATATKAMININISEWKMPLKRSFASLGRLFLLSNTSKRQRRWRD